MSKPKHLIVLLPGDGIGPEVVAEAKKVLDVIAEKRKHVVEFEFREEQIGGAAIDATGELFEAIVAKTVEKTKEHVSMHASLGCFGGFGRDSMNSTPSNPEQANLCPKRLWRPASSLPLSFWVLLEDRNGEPLRSGPNKAFWRSARLWTSTPTSGRATSPARRLLSTRL
jgi:hypothetical protein